MRWILSASEADEARVAAKLRASSKFYRFLWEIREELFDEAFEERLIQAYQPRGQEPCPPAMLAMVLLLQRYEGLSDARAVDAAENDRRWQLVLGTLGSDQAPFGQGSLVRFRTRLIGHELDRKLLDRTVELAKATGKFGWKKLRVALDSSPLEGAGRVEDTWNLIGRAMSKVVHVVSLVLEMDEDQVIAEAGLDVLNADSVKSALDIDWDDEGQQRKALQRLLRQVTKLESWVARRAKKQSGEPPLEDALTLLRRIVEQDIDPDPEGGGGPSIKEGVAQDRIISVGDPEMRHGRKSSSKRIDGYKRHIAVVDGFILSTAIKPANLREHEAAPDMLAAVEGHGEINVIDIDRGYVGSAAIEQRYQAGVTIHSRTWTKHHKPGFFSKDDFRIDLQRRTVTCPAKQTANIGRSNKVAFRTADCCSCELKQRCTTGSRRTLSIHREEGLHIRLRKARKTRQGRAELRKRVVVEHKLAQIGAVQGPKARYCGVRKNELDLNRTAAVVNLQRIALLRAA